MLLTEFAKDLGINKYFKTAKNISYSLLANYIELVLNGQWIGNLEIEKDFSLNDDINKYFTILDTDTDSLYFGDVYIILSDIRYRYGVYLDSKTVLEQPNHLTPQHVTLKADVAKLTAATKARGHKVVWLRAIKQQQIHDTHVDTARGSDLFDGSYDRPYKTIQRAVSTAIPGEKIYVMNGTYNERVFINNSGTINKPITLAAFPGHSPIIDGVGITWGSTTWGGLISIDSHSNWVFDGLTLKNSYAMGFGEEYSDVLPGSSNIIVRDCNVTDTKSSGVHFRNATNILIDNVTVLRPNIANSQEGITLETVENFEVRNCTVLEPRKEGIDAKNGCKNGKIHHCLIKKTINNFYAGPGIYIDAFAKHQYNIEIYENTINMPWGPGISTGAEAGGTLENVLVRNNIVYDSLRGYNIAANNTESGLAYVLKNITIRNNVAFNTGFSGVYIPAYITSALIENNIFYPASTSSTSGISIFSLITTDITKLIIRNNLYRAVNTFVPERPPGTAYLTEANYDLVMKDPTGTLTGSRDFDLTTTSAAIGAGRNGRDMGRYDMFMSGVDIVSRLELDKINLSLSL